MAYGNGGRRKAKSAKKCVGGKCPRPKPPRGTRMKSKPKPRFSKSESSGSKRKRGGGGEEPLTKYRNVRFL